MKENKLKPCPFCGGRATLWEEVTADRPFHILCGCGGRVGWFLTQEEAVQSWNRRAAERRMTMARYVDADALLENLKKQYGEELGWQCTINMSDVGMMIEDTPAADVVEVVRCKDCTEWDEKEGECSHWYGFRENDFCSYGERRMSDGTIY